MTQGIYNNVNISSDEDMIKQGQIGYPLLKTRFNCFLIKHILFRVARPFLISGIRPDIRLRLPDIRLAGYPARKTLHGTFFLQNLGLH